MDPWPEGRAADPEAARARYDSGMAAARRQARDSVRAELPDAHFGLGTAVCASGVVGAAAGPVAGLLTAGAFATLLVATLAVMRLRGIRGAEGRRRAYLFAFGWARWL